MARFVLSWGPFYSSLEVVEALSLKMLSELVELANSGLGPCCMGPLFTETTIRENHVTEPASHKVIEGSEETDSGQITTKPPKEVRRGRWS